MTAADTRPWTGHWVAGALGLSLLDDGRSPLPISDLVGMALRRNPRRAHLLVSRVLGKHVPADPRLVYGAGRLLGAVVGNVLSKDTARHKLNGTETAVEFLAAMLAGTSASWPSVAEAAAALVRECDEHAGEVRCPHGTVVLGYAETATGLGHAVADSIGADYLHSTRRTVAGTAPLAGFEEEHSHATSHHLVPNDPTMLARDAPLVLVDDELSTGQTVINTIVALHRLQRRQHYVVATLVDLRSPADRDRLAQLADDLGVAVDVVSLGSGQLTAGPDVLTRGLELVVEAERAAATTVPPRTAVGRFGTVEGTIRVRWPVPLVDGGRHGFPASARADLETMTAALGNRLARRLLSVRRDTPPTLRILVLGVEEFMHVPARTAAHLADALSGLDHPSEVLFSSTTRSPVLAVDEPGYAIRSALRFARPDVRTGSTDWRFAYNVSAGDTDHRFTDVVVMLDDAPDASEGSPGDGLLDALASVADHVHVIEFSSGPPVPLRAPEFGSYPSDDVAWLLTDLTHTDLEAPTEEREEAIQSGGAHYAESLPNEYQPSRQYQELFHAALAQSAPRLAHAVGVLTELALSERGPDVVLASLARAGTPIGVLMRRWARFAHQFDVPHYAVSIVRGKGIDTAALDFMTREHRPNDIMFVDGWTGKGAITRELWSAVGLYNEGRSADQTLCADLAVLADPGGCAQLFGSREDYLIPSACLNSTVSGLISRTVLNRDHLVAGQFHGAKFYSELASSDLSTTFIDRVVDCFAGVAGAVASDWPRVAQLDRSPTWSGWETVQKVSAAYGIADLNLIKPGVGETTRVLLRRVPWKILMRTGAERGLDHIRLLAEQRRVDIEFVDDLGFACIGLIHPDYTRGAVGADGRRAAR